MLTKQDLGQIREVVRTEITKETTPIRKDIKTLKSDVAKMRKDIDVMLSIFDRDYVDLRSRVERIEEHLNLPPATS